MPSVRVIWKYTLDVANVANEIELPVGAQFVAIETQPDLRDGRRSDWRPVIWALCDPDAPMETRRLDVVPTGAGFPDGMRHVGTFQLPDVGFVGHVLEVDDA